MREVLQSDIRCVAGDVDNSLESNTQEANTRGKVTTMFRWFAERSARKDAAERIYDSIVAQSRTPAFYLRAGVPDTLSGRFDMLVIHMFVVLHGLRKGGTEGELLGRELVEAFIKEMDSMVRDLGIGDAQVPREVRKIANLFYGQLIVYSDAVERRDRRALAEAVGRSFRSGDERARVSSTEIGDYMFDAIRSVGDMPLNLFLQGKVKFPELRGVRYAV